MFTDWLRYIINETGDKIIDEINNIKEVRDMFSTALEKTRKKEFYKGKQEGIYKEKIQTAIAIISLSTDRLILSTIRSIQ